MATQRAVSITVSQLAKAVDEAVQHASATAKVETQLSLGSGIIWGRWLRGVMDTQAAESLATSIASHVQETAGAGAGQGGGPAAQAVQAGAKLQPAALITNGRIICGFLPPPWDVLA